MACTEIVCGTGGFSGPKPGDPDNNSVLSAKSAFGGIDLTWTYPLVNPFAVSHINIFRGVSDNPDLAIRRNIASSSFYFDKIPANEIREYFYWIQIVSTNGTYGDWIGPVSATPKKTIDELLDQLSGQINESVLSDSLKDKFGELTLLKTDLDAEINSRLVGNAAMADALSAVQSETAQALLYFHEEMTQRTSVDEALFNSVNTLAVGLKDNAAAIQNESLARATDMSAVATQISTVQAQMGEQIAGVEVAMGAAIQDLEQTTDAIGALYTAKVKANGLVGGFGVYNDGTEVQAGFDVDTFWVGRTQENKRKPFIVSNGAVFIDQAAIQDASIETAKIADASITDAKIDSLDANKIKTGQLTADRIDATDLVAQHININSQTTGARLVMTDNVIKVYDENGVLRVRIGNLAA